MPYIGKSPQHGNYSKIDDISSGFDGSDATHAIASNSIAITPVRPEALIISINGVIQEPVTDYTVSGTDITFTTAPASGDSFFGVVMGEQLAIGTPSDATVTSAKLSGNLVTPGTLDVNGQELILDANGNTSITADTDDQIDIRIGGTDRAAWTSKNLQLTTILNLQRTTLTLSSGAATGTLSRHIIAAESGTSDDFDTLTATNYVDGDIVYLKADGSDKIYITIAGNFSQSILLDDSSWVPFIYDGSKFELLQSGWILQDTLTASNSVSLDFLKGVNAAYDRYWVCMNTLIPASNAGVSVDVRVSNDGSSFEADSTDYKWQQITVDNGSVEAAEDDEDSEIALNAKGLGELSDEGLSGDVYFDQPAASGLPVKFWWTISYLQGVARLVWGAGAAEYTTAETVNGIQVLMSAGNTSSGSVQLYGLKK